MTTHDWFAEHRAEYVARALPAREEALFRDHLGRCEECRRAVSELERDLAWLPMAVAPAVPRPGFTRRVVDDVVHPVRLWKGWVWPAFTAASLLLAVAGWLVSRETISRLNRELISREQALLATRDTVGLLLRNDWIMRAPIVVDGKQGALTIFDDPATHQWKVVVHGIPAAPANRRYTFWFITNDGMVHGTEIVVDERKPAILTLDMPPGAKLIKGCALTIEPREGDPSVPRGPELAHIEL
jgi:hypothetical protein